MILALRAPFAISRLWAEDGSVFLRQAIDSGVVRPFGHAYGGYYLFLPRVIGAIASSVPLRDAAVTTWVCVAAVVGWCAATIYAESEGLLTSFPSRAVLALSIVLLPALGLEAIASSSDLQYTLLFASLVALTGMSADRWSMVNRVAMVTVTALTTPLALFLAPVAAVRVMRLRPRRVDSTTAGWALGTVAQFAMILVGRPARVIASGKGLIVTHYYHWVLYENVLPKRLSSSTVTVAPLSVIVGVGLVVLACVLAWRGGRRASAVLLVVVPAVGFAFWTFAGIRYGLPVRYRVFPALCVIWCVLVTWEELLRAFRPRPAARWAARLHCGIGPRDRLGDVLDSRGASSIGTGVDRVARGGRASMSQRPDLAGRGDDLAGRRRFEGVGRPAAVPRHRRRGRFERTVERKRGML